MKKSFLRLNLFFLAFLSHQILLAQCSPYWGFDPSGHPCVSYKTQTSVSFLRIISDARSGGMGDVAIALTPDANAIIYNASKLALADKKWGISVDYTPWERKELNSEMFLKHAAGYYQFGKKKKQAIGLDARLFSLGIFEWGDGNGPLTEGTPKERALSISYSLQFNNNWAVGLCLKSIHSDYPSFFAYYLNSDDKKSKIIAFDISTTYQKPILFLGIETNVCLGAAISNMGNKFTYSSYFPKEDFLPTNLGLGSSLELNFNKNNKLLVALDFKKALTLTPISPWDTINYLPNWRNVSAAKSIFKSFTDSPDGLKGELREIATSIGLEYWLMQHVAFRAGYYHENKNTGGLQFYTFGTGLRYGAFNVNVSYLKTPNALSPIDNTWRFSLLVNGGAFKKY
jgi:hypothetical protein